MKKAIETLARITATILTASLLFTMLAGCRDNSGDDEPGFVVVPEIINPDVLGSIICLDYKNDTIFLATRFEVDKENKVNTTRIYTMDINSSDVLELPGYAPVFPAADAMGFVHISAMHVDSEEYIWISETGYFSRMNLPDDFDGEEWEKSDYVEEISSYNRISKLNSSGSEIFSIDLIPFFGDNRGADAIETDSEGNIYVLNDNSESAVIYVFDKTGNEIFNINTTGNKFSLVLLPDGKVVIAGEFDDTGFEFSLKEINTVSKEFGKIIKLSAGLTQVHTGSGFFDLLISDDTGLYGFMIDSGEKEELLNWKDSNLISYNQRFVRLLTNGRVLCGDFIIDTATYMYNIKLNILTRVPASEVDPGEVITLTLATFNPPPGLQNAVMEFNKSGSGYYIDLINYEEFSTNDDWLAGLSRLSTKIITGNAPDILDLRMMPQRQYISIGLLEDLYNFIDNDPELNRSSFMDGALRALEVNGGLYHVYPTFYINTLVGLSSVLGSDIGWNMKEFLEVIAANPEATVPLYSPAWKPYFMTKAVELNLYDYVDWNLGTAHFDSDEFLMLLEFVKSLPDNPPGSEPSRITSGEQIMAIIEEFNRFDGMQRYQAIFGGELVFKGFPTENRNGNSIKTHSSLAISSLSPNKEGAWKFIRMLLTDDWLTGKLEHDFDFAFPLNKEAFFTKLERYMADSFHGSGRWEDPDYTYTLRPVTQEEVNQILNLIDSLSGTSGFDIELRNIVWEASEEFFNGRGSAQDTARKIQSRAAIFMSEQTG
ncbi:MAG: extracellular solute-binding protein [Oscillospiraceae bacterium]|nr:extracellular solute-binding protein [Oscillospiraceae bacterium]